MISFQKQFLYVHIHKTAGNSIQSVLRHYSEDEIVNPRAHQDGVERFGVRNRNYAIKKHSTLADYRGALGEAQFSRLYKFASVRNPWDRMISFYFTPSQGPVEWDRKKFRKLVERTLSVAEYLRLGKDDADPFDNVDFIIRFERLGSDFNLVCDKIGIPRASLPSYNQSERDHYSKYYDDELRSLVEKRFALEIKRFDYRFA